MIIIDNSRTRCITAFIQNRGFIENKVNLIRTVKLRIIEQNQSKQTNEQKNCIDRPPPPENLYDRSMPHSN